MAESLYRAFKFGEAIVSIRYIAEIAWREDELEPERSIVLPRLEGLLEIVDKFVKQVNLRNGALQTLNRTIKDFWIAFLKDWKDPGRTEEIIRIAELDLDPEHHFDVQKHLLKDCPTGKEIWNSVEDSFKKACSDRDDPLSLAALVGFHFANNHNPNLAEAKLNQRSNTQKIEGTEAERHEPLKQKLRELYEVHRILVKKVPRLTICDFSEFRDVSKAMGEAGNFDRDSLLKASSLLAIRTESALRDPTRVPSYFDMTLNFRRQTISRQDTPQKLTRLSWEMMLILLRFPDKQCTKDKLMQAWEAAKRRKPGETEKGRDAFHQALSKLRKNMARLGIKIVSSAMDSDHGPVWWLSTQSEK